MPTPARSWPVARRVRADVGIGPYRKVCWRQAPPGREMLRRGRGLSPPAGAPQEAAPYFRGSVSGGLSCGARSM
ncbi:MAG: hypothetical protein ACLRWQ_20750 [Flavonifractor plautii]